MFLLHACAPTYLVPVPWLYGKESRCQAKTTQVEVQVRGLEMACGTSRSAFFFPVECYIGVYYVYQRMLNPELVEVAVAIHDSHNYYDRYAVTILENDTYIVRDHAALARLIKCCVAK